VKPFSIAELLEKENIKKEDIEGALKELVKRLEAEKRRKYG
jgi:hypothetical protein